MPTDLAAVEEQALTARRRLGAGSDGPIADLLRLIELKGGVRVFIVGLPKPGIEGLYSVERGVPLILVNQNRHPVAKRFTLAHEYGHHFLDHGPRLDEKIELGDRSKFEREANHFAGAFLMPREAIATWFGAAGDPDVDLETLVQFAADFGVSPMAARIRLQFVKRLTSPTAIRKLDEDIAKSRHNRLKKKLGIVDMEDWIAAAHTAGAHVPFDQEQRIANLIDRGLLNEQDAQRLLRVDEDEAARQLARLRESSDAG